MNANLNLRKEVRVMFGVAFLMSLLVKMSYQNDNDGLHDLEQ